MAPTRNADSFKNAASAPLTSTGAAHNLDEQVKLEDYRKVSDDGTDTIPTYGLGTSSERLAFTIGGIGARKS